ncbi:MAG: DUF1844 domain-containing protein [candidate division Zixibacteria bacterium]|nr:DUF1844 domain-containing protein [candidate division Zixibacteria bacterium]
MTDTEKHIDMHFFTLVSSLQMAAWQQMGKIASPISGKVERNLDQARASIDMLNMIFEKTKGNLSGEEDKLLLQILYDLRMNYLDETQKPAEKKADTDTSTSDTKSAETEKTDKSKGDTEKTEGAES